MIDVLTKVEHHTIVLTRMLMHLLCFLIDVLTKVKHHTIVVTKVTTTSPPYHAIMSGPSIDEQVRGALPACKRANITIKLFNYYIKDSWVKF